MATVERPYRQPRLTIHGDIAGLTRALGGSGSDGLAGSQIAVPSDRAIKEQVAPIDAREVLRRVRLLPITRSRQESEAGARQIGPDPDAFTEAFGVGRDPRAIEVVDAMGVSLAAVQGLARTVEEQQAELARLRAELAALREIDRPEDLERKS